MGSDGRNAQDDLKGDMALSAGTVTVDGNGNVSGTGLSRAIYDAQVTFIVTAIGASLLVAQKQNVAGFSNALGDAIVTYVTANAEVSAGTFAAHVTSESLGKTPNPVLADTPIVAPDVPVDVPLSGTGTIG